MTKEQCQDALNNLKIPTDDRESLNLQLAENNEEPVEYENKESMDILQKLINEHFNSSSMEFKHFKLYADSTLRSMTKAQLINYIHTIYYNWKYTDIIKERLHNVIHSLTNNPPLKFEELEKETNYYHVDYGWILIINIFKDGSLAIFNLSSDGYKVIEFEENSLYKKGLL